MNPPLRLRPLWLGIGWCLVGAVVWLSLTPSTGAPPLINDKLAHLIAYFTLTAWFAEIYSRLDRVGLAMLALGAALEVAQGLSGYRDMSFADLLANAAGIGLGMFAAARFPRVLAKLDARLT